MCQQTQPCEHCRDPHTLGSSGRDEDRIRTLWWKEELIKAFKEAHFLKVEELLAVDPFDYLRKVHQG